MEYRDWLADTLKQLSRAGETGQATVDFLSTRSTRIRLIKLPPAAGAAWFLDRSIYLNTRYFTLQTPTADPRLLSLLVHEARHLQQGFHTAFSVYGELDAWQVDFNFQKSLTGSYPSAAVTELCSLPLRLDRVILKRAAQLMQAHAGKGYRIDLYPLFPLLQEIRWQLKH